MLLYLPAGGFDAESERLAVWLAAQAAIAVENARLHHVVQHQAVMDELTGLVNRRRFMAAAEHEIACMSRTMPPALILADLRRLQARQRPLRDIRSVTFPQSFARALGEHVRDVDIAARLGGEEFAVLLPETHLDGALARRLRHALDRAPLLVRGGAEIAATASLGVAQLVEGEAWSRSCDCRQRPVQGES